MNGTIVEITGTPVAEFEFVNLPTWNRLLAINRWKRQKITNELVAEGKELGLGIKSMLPAWQQTLPMVDRALMLIKIWPPYEEISDIHNVSIKAVCDGFRDAKVFEDDEWAWMPLVVIMWAGISETKERTTLLEIHELAGLIINGESQILPLGRERL